MELITQNLKFSPFNQHNPICTNKKGRLFFSIGYNPLQFNNGFNGSTKFHSVTIAHARKKISKSESPVLKPTIVEEVSADDDDLEVDEGDLLSDDELGNEEFLDDGDYFEDEDVTENAEVYAGDGGEGGGISLAGTWWDKEALAMAEAVTESFDGDLKIYAFRTLANATIQVRIEKLSTKYGSPNMNDIEAFSAAYRARLDDAELAKTIPENISLEVSSPGVERAVRVPQELDRFKEKPLYVKYINETEGSGLPTQNEGVFRLISFDLDTNTCTWGLADVRINREKAGKGRPMNKKQREWRLTTPFDSIRLVRVYSEV